jgi:hypothetical protein
MRTEKNDGFINLDLPLAGFSSLDLPLGTERLGDLVTNGY